jgi:hypothetical protein
MVFPATPLQPRVELFLGSAWTDVTSYTYAGINIGRGRSDEGSSGEPSSCRLALNNRDGRFSPRNPMSPYYGQLGRNTPVRVSIQAGARRLTGSASVTTPDSVALSVTGDLDVRFDGSIPSWATGANFVTKAEASGTWSFWFSVDSNGYLNFDWSTDGTTFLSGDATVPLPQTTGRQAVRATLDVNNGAGGRTITFYTAPTAAGPWTQLGGAVVQAGTTSIFNSTAQVRVNTYAGWEVYSAEMRNGIGGSLVANPVFSAQAELATSFSDGLGNTWTVPAGGAVTDRRYRFHGEVASWPVAWDVAGVDVRTSVEAAGVLRRIGQGADPLKSTIQRWVLRGAVPVYGYWPMDDETGSTTMASGLPAGAAMSVVGTPDLASDETFASSNPLPVLAGASFAGAVSTHAPTGSLLVHMLMMIPSTGEPSDGVLLRVHTTGTAGRWDVVHETATDVLRLYAYNADGAVILTSPPFPGTYGKAISLNLQLVQNGANIDWGWYLNGYVDPTPGLGGFSGTLVGRTAGTATRIDVNPTRTLTETTVGQVIVYAGIPNGLAQIQALRGYVSESAGRRIERLCAEEGLAFVGYGDLDDTPRMGPQLAATLLDLFAEVEAVDLGQMFEPREQLGIAYRTRASLQFQTATLALAYGDLTDLQPVEDDQGTRNDVTVTRVGGSSARATLDVGPLSTQPPPAGVGRYTDSVELSLWTDAQLADQANWRVALGTIDEARYPEILVRLETASFANSAALTDAALRLDVGDLLTISGLPSWLPPDEIRQHAIGQSEQLNPFEYAISYTCVPVIPAGASALYDVLGRYSSGSSTLSAGITSGAMTLAIATPAGAPLWTSNPTDFPLDVMVGGERITLSAIAATASPQTATVSARSVNGVVKAHAAGAGLDVADPSYYAF